MSTKTIILNLKQLETKLKDSKYEITNIKNIGDISIIAKYIDDLEQNEKYEKLLKQIINYWTTIKYKINNIDNLIIIQKYICMKEYKPKSIIIAGTYEFFWYNYFENDIRPENIFKLNFKLIVDKLNEYFKDSLIEASFEKATFIDKQLKKPQNTYKHDVLIKISSKIKINEDEKPYEIVLEYFEKKHNRFNDDDKSISAQIFTDIYGVFDEKDYNTKKTRSLGMEKFIRNTIIDLIKIVCAVNNDKYELSKLLYLKNNKNSKDEIETFNKIINYKRNITFDLGDLHKSLKPRDPETGDNITLTNFIEILHNNYEIIIKKIKLCESKIFDQIIINSESSSFESHRLEFYKRIYLQAINSLDEASNEIIKLIKQQRNKRYYLTQFMINFEKFHRVNSKIVERVERV
jgi:hypothetical protein